MGFELIHTTSVAWFVISPDTVRLRSTFGAVHWVQSFVCFVSVDLSKMQAHYDCHYRT